jgi:hypothetical protein
MKFEHELGKFEHELKLYEPESEQSEPESEQPEPEPQQFEPGFYQSEPEPALGVAAVARSFRWVYTLLGGSYGPRSVVYSVSGILGPYG